MKFINFKIYKRRGKKQEELRPRQIIVKMLNTQDKKEPEVQRILHNKNRKIRLTFESMTVAMESKKHQNNVSVRRSCQSECLHWKNVYLGHLPIFKN